MTMFDREVALARLADESFDVVVVGGGITGAGVALDAASRGFRTALVERGDFASGTSSKSSKLVHGGLRYLQQREFGLVHESLKERHLLLQNAPHLVEPLTFLIPLFGKGGAVDRAVARTFSTALWMYDLGGGWRIGKRHRRITAAEFSSHLPTVRTDRLVAGFVYYDARTDDARLTLAVLRTAVLEHGAVAINYAPVTGFLHDEAGHVAGVRVEPIAEPCSGAWMAGSPASVSTADLLEVSAKVVVNATGVWADELRRLDDPAYRASIRPAKGIHFTVPRSKLPCDCAVVLPVPKDRRSIFVIPWDEHTMLGTTDTDYSGPLDDPRVEREDIAYVLGAVNAALSSPLKPEDVTASWAGLRPLLAAPGPHGRAPSARTADLSRRHKVEHSISGLVSITGGKLTTYRKMAADTVDAVQRELGSSPVPCRTKHLRLRGSEDLSALRVQELAAGLGLDPEIVDHLRRRYGGDAMAVLGLTFDRPELRERLVVGLPHLEAEVVYAARYEMATCVEDFLSRRTRALLVDARSAAAAAERTAVLLAAELGWDATRASEEAARFRAIERHDLAATGALGAERSPMSET
ncbi:MAG TPA: glycerol-3-phosphate dehydrogenase/oxidase [Acidimicrobiales bacterium]|nr:glycerol-3-phosphate dehydrogenase/oxidase [Acidimicrobiales bacterium]